jgi:lysyl-tRNA synthetase class 2
MTQCEDLLVFIVRRAKGSESLTYQGEEIRLKRPWLRLTVSEAFERYAAMSISEAWQNDMFEEIMVNKIEPALPAAAPVFLYDYPAFCAALARYKPHAASLAERFELYIGGLELCNGFSELTDPVEQRIRFKKEMAARRDAHKTVTPMPEQYLNALADVPDAAGNALGIDRLAMLLTNSATIDEVVAYIPEEL